MDLVSNFRIILTISVIIRTSWVDGFIPNWQYQLLSVSISQTHQDIIEDAVRQVAKEYMNDHLDIYPAADQDKFLHSSGFTGAIGTFREYVAKPDLDADKKNDPVFHFDAERIIQSNDKLKTARADILQLILALKFQNAQQSAGLVLHTLQDFYSHSNWVESMNNDIPYLELGDKKLTALTRPVAAGDTCSDCSSSSNNACYAYFCEKDETQAVITSQPFSNCVAVSGIYSCINRFFNTSVTSSAFYCTSADNPLLQISYLTSIADPDTCLNNILDTVNTQGELTTGYYSNEEGFTFKPSGKCSHGGPFDCTRFDHATGGINKDSSAPYVSPHYYLHSQAAGAAVKATALYLDRIKDDLVELRLENLFPQFIGLSTGDTLCFVIDTTASMGEEIAAVRNQTIQLTRYRSSGADKPSNYLLVPFNDPGWGPVYSTTDPSAMMQQLTQLTAAGGSGVSEMGYHGIFLALQNVQPNSVCHFFTDSPSGDLDLYSMALALKLSKNVKFQSWLTPYLSTNFTENGQAAQHTAITDYSRFILTGRGYMHVLRKMDIMEAVGAISVSILQVKLFRCDDRQFGFPFLVDSLMSGISLIVSDNVGSLLSISVTSLTNGTQYTNFQTSVDLPSLKEFKFNTVSPGWWYANVSTDNTTNINGSFSASVQGDSLINFKSNFALFSHGTHPGYIQINNNPLAGSSYFILITITGSLDPTTNQPRFIQNVTRLCLLSTTGDILQNLTLREVTPLEEYEAEAVLPKEAFRIAIEGIVDSGLTFRRMNDASIQTSVVDLSMTDNSFLSILPGGTVATNVLMTNRGPAAHWDIRISDSATFYTGLETFRVTLNTNESVLLNMSFKANSSSIVGTESTVIVTAGTSSATSVENYVVFPVTVVSPDYTTDTKAPFCNILTNNVSACSSYNTYFNCSDYMWIIAFMAQDRESGLFLITPTGPYSNDSFYVDPFTVGTIVPVNGTYESSCCYTNVTIAVFDRYGNKGVCGAPANPQIYNLTNPYRLVIILACSIAGAFLLVVIVSVIICVVVSKMKTGAVGTNPIA